MVATPNSFFTNNYLGSSSRRDFGCDTRQRHYVHALYDEKHHIINISSKQEHDNLISINPHKHLPKIVFPPSSFILNTSKEFPKIFFDLELPFRYQLSQSDKQYFCEVGYVPNPSKIKRPSSYSPHKYILLPFQKVTK